MTVDDVGFIKSLASTSKQIRAATMTGLTRTAIGVRSDEQAEMRRVFDRPTNYSLNAFQVMPATRTELNARIEQRGFGGGGRPREWFNPQVYGGQRNTKAFERKLAAVLGLPSASTYFMPGPAARLDRYGNISGGQLQQVLSDLGAQTDRAQNASASSRKRNKRARHVVIGRRGGRRFFIGTRQGSKLSVVLTITDQAPSYSKRFDFFGVAERGSRKRFPVEFDRAFMHYVGTGRAR